MKGPNGEQRRGDTVQRAVQVARIATGEAAEQLPEPRRRKGGLSRRGALSSERRSEIARGAGAMSEAGGLSPSPVCGT